VDKQFVVTNCDKMLVCVEEPYTGETITIADGIDEYAVSLAIAGAFLGREVTNEDNSFSHLREIEYIDAEMADLGARGVKVVDGRDLSPKTVSHVVTNVLIYRCYSALRLILLVKESQTPHWSRNGPDNPWDPHYDAWSVTDAGKALCSMVTYKGEQ